MKIKDVIKAINKYAPENLACEWDNTGLQVGSGNEDIEKAVICVDVNAFVVDEAVKTGAKLIVSHHPLLFHPVYQITDGAKGELIKRLVKNDINVYSSHTSFDMSSYGINAYCAHKLGIKTDAFLEASAREGFGIGVCGELENKCSVSALAQRVKKVFSAGNVKLSYVAKDSLVSRAAFCSGSGSSYIEKAAELGADVLITADCKNSDFIAAYEKNIALVCPTHFESEKCFIKLMKGILSRELPELEITESEAKDFEYYI